MEERHGCGEDDRKLKTKGSVCGSWKELIRSSSSHRSDFQQVPLRDSRRGRGGGEEAEPAAGFRDSSEGAAPPPPSSAGGNPARHLLGLSQWEAGAETSEEAGTAWAVWRTESE